MPLFKLIMRELELEEAEMDFHAHRRGHTLDELVAMNAADNELTMTSTSTSSESGDEEAPRSSDGHTLAPGSDEESATSAMEMVGQGEEDEEDEEDEGDGDGDVTQHKQKHKKKHKKRWRSRSYKSPLEVEQLAAMDPALRAKLVDMWALPNLALPLSYFTIGFAMTFTGTPLTVYAVSELGIGSAQLNICGTMLALPWSFKVLYGLLSDCVPIMGKRRKPYFVIGWAAYVLTNLALAALGRPSLNALIALGFFSVCGYMLSDVMCDAIIVERSKLEPEGRVGTMQAVGYVCRYIGNVCGATLGTVLYNKEEWHWGLSIAQVFLLNGLVAVACVLPVAYWLEDPAHHAAGRSLRTQLEDIWHMVQRRTIFKPMAFVAIYNMLMIPNAAWSNFLILGLKFTPWMLGIMFMVATVFSWLGITFYRAFLMKYSWRWVYIVSTILTMGFSVLQLLLIFRINVKWGINDLAFALGDDAIANFVSAMQFLPTVTMYLGLVPCGAEGTAYAMLTTLSNVAGAIGSDIGTLMTGVWDVSNEALEGGAWGGLWKLSLLTSLIQPLGLCLLWLLPRDVAHQRKMQRCDKRNFWGGLGFITFLVVAWGWTLIQTLTYMIKGA